jgi:uncharacterized protein
MTTRKAFARLLVTAALLLAPPALAQETAPASSTATQAPASVETVDADPALWVVRDDDTTIYLFGTAHILKRGLSWFDEAVKTAFDESDELKIEVILPEDLSTLGPVLARYVGDPAGRALTSRMTEEQRAAYTTGMEQAGVPFAAVEQFDPWFVGLQLVAGITARAGYQAGSGAETVLTAAAKTANKPITAFETVEDQFGFLDSTPESEQISSLLEMLRDMGAAGTMLDGMMANWAAGKPEETSAIMNQAMVTTPETRRILLTDRNRRWAETLSARMAQPGTVFVAVGAGHLAGEDSVQVQLAEMGITAERVVY